MRAKANEDSTVSGQSAVSELQLLLLASVKARAQNLTLAASNRSITRGVLEVRSQLLLATSERLHGGKTVSSDHQPPCLHESGMAGAVMKLV